MLSKFRRANTPYIPWSVPIVDRTDEPVPEVSVARGARMIVAISKGHNSAVVKDPNDLVSKPVESDGEYLSMLVAIADPQVKRITAQAAPFEFVDPDGVIHEHYLDLVLEMADGSRSGVAVKDADRARRTNFAGAVDHMVQFLPHGLADHIVLITKDDLPAWMVANARLIHSARLDRVRNLDELVIAAANGADGQLPIRDLIRPFGSQAFRSVARLIYAGRLRTVPEACLIEPDALVVAVGAN